MKNIRKHINENRSLFDDKEPSAGHMERFEALLDKQQSEEKVIVKSHRRTLFVRTLAVAASLAILLGIGIKFYNPQPIKPIPAENKLDINEFQTTNDYYSQQMEMQISDIMCKLAHTDVENQIELTKDLEKIMDNNSSFIKEMANNENKEMALRYLVKHYKANIQALESINDKLGKYTNC